MAIDETDLPGKEGMDLSTWPPSSLTLAATDLQGYTHSR